MIYSLIFGNCRKDRNGIGERYEAELVELTVRFTGLKWKAEGSYDMVTTLNYMQEEDIENWASVGDDIPVRDAI